MALTQVKSDGIADGAVTTNDLSDSGVTAGTYGSSSAIPAITVDAKGRITSASTSSIDSTAITNGTSNVSVAASGDITATRSGTTRLTVNNTGVTFSGDVEIRDATPVLTLKDTDSTGNAVFTFVQGTNSADSQRWFVGDASPNNEDVYLANNSNANIRLDIAGTTRLRAHSAGIEVTGSVTCDGLTCEGAATIASSNGALILKDNDNSGTSSQSYIQGKDSGNANQWYVGTGTSANLEVWNYVSGEILFATNNVHRATFTTAGHFVPNGNNTYDLGTSSVRWRNLYTNDLNLSNEGSANDVDGTWGNWTIQEGEDDLFLLNRRNGKKYKFNLTEVN